jgi:hypothetical protein
MSVTGLEFGVAVVGKQGRARVAHPVVADQRTTLEWLAPTVFTALGHFA